MSVISRTGTQSPANRASTLPDVVGLGGALAGLGGGLAMMVIAALISAWIRNDIWLESKQIAALLYGPAVAQEPGFVAGPVITGTLLHFLTAALLGALYSILTRRVWRLPSEFGVPVLTGLIYGLLIWTVAYFIVLPVINPVLLETYARAFIVQHVVYGMVTGLLYAWLRPSPYGDGDVELPIAGTGDARR